MWLNPDEIFLSEGKMCGRYLEDIRHDGLQGHGHTDGIKLEVVV